MKSPRLLRLLLALMILAVAGWFMRGYTTDDTYIHLRYAHNLIERGEFSFNPGSSSYGATSPLWIFGLALLLKTGLGPFPAAWLLGVLSGLGVILLLEAILTRLTFSDLWRGLLLVLAVADPWFLRWTFSGMETPLATFFLLALLFPLVAPVKPGAPPLPKVMWRRYLAWGATAGLAGLVRPEFMVLAPAALPWLLMFEKFRARSRAESTASGWVSASKLLAASVGGWLTVVLPWAVYAWSAFGRFTPGTASAKSSALSLDPFLLVPNIWQSVRTLAAGQGLLWIALLVLAGLVLHGNRAGSRRKAVGWKEWRRNKPLVDAEPPASRSGPGPWSVWGPVVLVGITATWTVVLLGGYAAKQVWIISRYVSPLSPVLLLAMGVIAEWLLGGKDPVRSVRRTGAAVIIAGSLLTVGLDGWIMADQVVPHARKFPEGIRNCYLGFGRWLSLNTPPDAVVAALDIGAVGYASDRRVLDLMGLVSPEILAVGQRTGFAEMVEKGLWVDVPEAVSGRRADYFVDRGEGVPRWDGRIVAGVRFELLDTCTIEGVGLREPQPWTVALYRLVSTESRFNSSAGG